MDIPDLANWDNTRVPYHLILLLLTTAICQFLIWGSLYYPNAFRIQRDLLISLLNLFSIAGKKNCN